MTTRAPVLLKKIKNAHINFVKAKSHFWRKSMGIKKGKFSLFRKSENVWYDKEKISRYNENMRQNNYFLPTQVQFVNKEQTRAALLSSYFSN